MSFTKETAKEIVESHGFIVEDHTIYHSNGEPVKCTCCEHEIDTEHLGHILPGSYNLYCDNPICFNNFLVNLV